MERKINGLTEKEVIESRAKHGDNSLKKEKSKGLVRRFLDNLSDPIIKILLIALTVQVVLTFKNCNILEICGILIAILISTCVSTLSEYTSERSFEKLRESDLDSKVCVIRARQSKYINSSEVVVGDIIYLNAGEKIVADGKLIKGELFVNQSALNGESEEISKKPDNSNLWDLSSKNKLFRGSLITVGEGYMEVEKVGSQTFYGQVATDLQTETRISPLKMRLEKLAKQISKIGCIMAAIVAVAYLFNVIVIDNAYDINAIVTSLKDYKFFIKELTRALTLMITVVVVSAPEGLPMMITVVLSANMKKLVKDNILVKKMVGIETAGSMNILFTDKTGTITEGKPKCEKIICESGEISSVAALRKCGEIYKSLCISAKLNTDARIENGTIMGGNSTDRAILEWFANEEISDIEITEKQHFSSDKKSSLISMKNGKVILKGAAEMIISLCDTALLPDGSLTSLDKKKYLSAYRKLALSGGRVLAVATYDKRDQSHKTLVALIALKDKVRLDAKAAVHQIQNAGIQIVMITGDSKETASAIAKECGILKNEDPNAVLSADELSKMTDEELKKRISSIRVIARAMPRDKTRLVKLSQEMNLVAGMTGDGINDAPSLKLSDVGFAMGSGTDIAKSAADIVVLDDSLTAIGKTVLYGRTIFKSIRKFICFQLIMNLAACGVSIIGQFIGIETPITIIQMLWVNIIMDTLGGLAFAGEPAAEHYMKEKPKSRDEEILTRDMLHQIAYTGAYTLAISIFFLSARLVRNYYGFYTSPDAFYAAFYALFIFSGIANCFASRGDRLWMFSGIGKNRIFIILMFLIALVQIFMIYLGGEIFRCVPLEIGELMLSITLALTVIPFDFIRRIMQKLS